MGYAHAWHSGPTASGKSESFMYQIPAGSDAKGPDTCPSCKQGNLRPFGLSDDARSVLMHCSKGCGHTETRDRKDRVQDLWGGA